MRIIRFIDPAGEEYVGLDGGGPEAEILDGDPFNRLHPTGHRRPIARLLPPVAPVNIFCIGLNYKRHAEESRMDLPPHPVVFLKPTTAVQGPQGPIVLPASARPDEVDFECELVCVIGTRTRDVPPAQALEHVLGYTCGNDVSARHWQMHGGGGQWCHGKGFDTFCPLGPVLVTADEIPDPQRLALRTRLNGRIMQEHTTADMIFPVAELISFLSQDTTLLPGTVIMTGTPQGVGFARRPPVFLQPGDRIEVEIEGIGTLRNPVVAA